MVMRRFVKIIITSIVYIKVCNNIITKWTVQNKKNKEIYNIITNYN